jgi:hypothetical protein
VTWIRSTLWFFDLFKNSFNIILSIIIRVFIGISSSDFSTSIWYNYVTHLTCYMFSSSLSFIIIITENIVIWDVTSCSLVYIFRNVSEKMLSSSGQIKVLLFMFNICFTLPDCFKWHKIYIAQINSAVRFWPLDWSFPFQISSETPTTLTEAFRHSREVLEFYLKLCYDLLFQSHLLMISYISILVKGRRRRSRNQLLDDLTEILRLLANERRSIR